MQDTGKQHYCSHPSCKASLDEVYFILIEKEKDCIWLGIREISYEHLTIILIVGVSYCESDFKFLIQSVLVIITFIIVSLVIIL
jgi:hypothetical protein